MSSARRQAFHETLDEIHVHDINLHTAQLEDLLSAYERRFEALPDDIDFGFELSVWQEHNPVTVPARFIAQSGLYIPDDAPRDTTPISAEQWEAMHGIGQEPIQDERTIMMIRRQIIEGTAGYFGRTAFDSVRVWRLYGTPSGEIWGAQWGHFKTAHGNVVDWRETTWGSMQHVRQFIDATAEFNDVVAAWERY